MPRLTSSQCDRIIAWCESHKDIRQNPIPGLGWEYYTWQHQELDDMWCLASEFNCREGSQHCQVLLTPPRSMQNPHRDSHGSYHRWRRQTPHHRMLRTWVSLTEPQMGHVVMYDWWCLYNMPRGEIIVLPEHQIHQAVNASDQPRWTMVVDHELV